MKYEFAHAREENREELLALYGAQKGREGCFWTEEYPSDETIDFDLSRNALYVMKAEDRIVGAVSIDEDEAINNLPCWNHDLDPEIEFARIAILPELQGRGLAKILLRFLLDELKKQGYRGVHIMVNRENPRAIRLYDGFHFANVGECQMYEQDFYCYELALI